MLAKARDYLDNINDAMVMLLLIGMAIFVVGFSLGAHFQSGAVNLWAWADSFFQNFGTEMVGAFLTFYLIEVLRGGKREREAKEQEKEALKRKFIREMGSDVRDVAVSAANELRTRGWGFGKDGSLRQAELHGANLEKADLREANLQEAYLTWTNLEGVVLVRANLKEAVLMRANLKEAALMGANLEGAYLRETNLEMANLTEASLEGTDLREANLKGAHLMGANLEGADLMEVNLEGADLREANLEGTKLPNGAQWTSDTDMVCFTDPKHPDFWRSDAPESPAYGGE